MIKALRKRIEILKELENTDVAAVPAAIKRFLSAIDRESGGDPIRLTRGISDLLIEELRVSTDTDLVEAAIAILTESSAAKGGALYFDAEGDFPISLLDRQIEDPLCKHLRQIDLEKAIRLGQTGICGITGEAGPLVVGNFSQPNLPYTGQSFLYARNDAIPATSRYGKSSAASIPVGYMTDIRLRAAVEALSSKCREGKTWRGIPSEIPKQNDLLLAFVVEALEESIANLLADDSEKENFSEEGSTSPTATDSIAAFEKRTERLIKALEAKVHADWRNTSVHLIIIRAVDEGNRKAVYAGIPTAAGVYDAATEWIEGERNIPDWLNVKIRRKDEPNPHLLKALHIAPLGLIKFSKQIFLHNGKRPAGKKKEQPGIPASEALRLFLDVKENSGLVQRSRIERILRLALARRTALIKEASHTQRRGWADPRTYDSYEAMRTLTLFGVLLHKLNRKKEEYMTGTAFMLGQLLAAADAVHAGYCADVRGGSLPPSLLGNQVLIMAQASPAKALAVLGSRWKPYAGWAKKKSDYEIPREFLNEDGSWKKRADFANDQKRQELERSFSIAIAIIQSRRVEKIAHELNEKLSVKCDDVFRAELLLGYMAGIPGKQKVDAENPNTNEKED